MEYMNIESSNVESTRLKSRWTFSELALKIKVIPWKNTPNLHNGYAQARNKTDCIESSEIRKQSVASSFFPERL